MFVVVYRWRLKPGAEDEFAADWREVTLTARDQGGALGSALFTAGDGTWAAIARWPDRRARDDFFARQVFSSELLERQRAAVVERLPALELDLVDDLWAPTPD